MCFDRPIHVLWSVMSDRGLRVFVSQSKGVYYEYKFGCSFDLANLIVDCQIKNRQIKVFQWTQRQ